MRMRLLKDFIKFVKQDPGLLDQKKSGAMSDFLGL